MTEPTVQCPKCGTSIKLTESLAAPLVDSLRRDYEKRLAEKDTQFASREKQLKTKEEELAKAKASIEDIVADRMKGERSSIAAEEARKAKLALTADIDKKSREVADLSAIVKDMNAKLIEAQKAQAAIIRKERELEDAKRELGLNVEKGIQEGLRQTRDQARKEVEEQLMLKMTEKELTITALHEQIDEMKRRAEQGSQQSQGEALEWVLEGMLRDKFPHDTIEPVPKGMRGSDIIQTVVSPSGQQCGTIIWEAKRTSVWKADWLVKLRDDQRIAKADIAVIVSQALPKGVETFELVDGVWVAHLRMAVPMAMVLRNSLIDLAATRKASEGQHTKTEMVYRYLTGAGFRQRVEAIVEAFSTMQEDLASEKRAIEKQWAKREAQIDRVMHATVGMYGDLQGIAGKSVPEIEGLSMRAIEEPKRKR